MAAAAAGLLLAVPAVGSGFNGGRGSAFGFRQGRESLCSSVQLKLLPKRWKGENGRDSSVVMVVVQVQSHSGGRGGGYLAARDREIEFGKFKGSLLGTMSSKYLKWMAKNLRVGLLSEWAEYAEEVLQDPYYQDRLEWEKVEKMMTVAHDVGRITGNRDVLAPARVFGWDLEDDDSWRKVNFALLGTTRGGRIPRVKEGQAIQPAVPAEKKKKRLRRQSVSIRTQPASLSTPEAASQGSLRDELARRREMRRDRLMANRSLRAAEIDEEAARVMNPFPGRDSLVSKVRSYDISE